MENNKKPVFLAAKHLKPAILDSLHAQGIQTFFLEPAPLISTELKYHPDILLCSCGDGTFVTSKSVYEKNSVLFDSLGMNVIVSRSELCDIYPQDVRFNAFFAGDTLFCSKHTAREIRDRAPSAVMFRQGYVKCSVAVIDSETYITADRGIFEVLSSLKRNVLLIPEGDIGLSGFSCGFIGGAGGMITPDTFALFGDAKTLSGYELIKDFLTCRGIRILSFARGPCTITAD